MLRLGTSGGPGHLAGQQHLDTKLQRCANPACGKLERRDGRLVATAFTIQDSSMLSPLAQADCLIIREPYAPAAAAGSDCVILRLPG